MSSAAQNLFPLDKTDASGSMEHLLGQIGCFRDFDRSNLGPGALPELSMMDVWARWVKNESGGTLTPGTCITWDTGSTFGPGRACGAAAATTTTVGVGVVSNHLPSAGVADNLHFWIIFKGPCEFKFTTGTALGIADNVAVGATGRVVDLDHTSLSDQLLLDRCGKSLTVVGSGVSNDTLFRGYADFRF